MAVTFSEDVGSPTYGGRGYERRATRTGDIPWSDIDAFYTELFPVAVAGIPQLPALLPGSATLRVSDVSFKPPFPEADITSTSSTGVASPVNAYDTAQVTIQYVTTPYEQDNPATDQVITRRRSVGGEVMTLPNTGIRWVGDSGSIKSPDAQSGKRITMVRHELTFHFVQVGSVPWATIRSLMGKVNDDTFEGAAAETLLFEGLDIQDTFDSAGNQTAQMTLQFLERLIDGSHGWNHLFDDDPTSAHKGEWREVETTSGEKVFPTGDFDLFL